MLGPVASSLAAFAALAPMLIVLAAAWRPRWPRARWSEIALAALLSLAALGIAAVEILSLLPVARPMKIAPWVHAGAGLAAAAWCIARRRRVARRSRGLVARFRAATQEAGPLARVGVPALLAAHAAVAAMGLWVWTFYQDEAAYHWPQALQVVAAGRVGPVEAPAIWADSYPRGAPHLWAWMLAVTGTDAAVRPVNALAALTLALAALVASRRLGATRGVACVAAAAAVTTPVLSLLSLIVYNDALATAAVGAGLALLLPRRSGERSEHAAPWAAIGLALALAAWIKFPAFVVLGVVVALRVGVTLAIRPRPRPTPAIVAVVLALALAAAVPFARTWLAFGSPVYPLRVALMGRTVFDGPMTADALRWEGDQPWLARLWHFWSSLGSPMDSEGPGQFGPLWLLAMLPALLVLVLAWFASPRRGGLGPALLALAFALAVLLPNFHWARYSAWLVVPGTAALAWALSAWPLALRRAAATGVIALAAANAALFWHGFWPRVAEAVAVAGDADLFGPARLVIARDRLDQSLSFDPRPATRRLIATHAPAGGLVWSTLFSSPLWLHELPPRYRVVVRPAAPFPAFDYGFDLAAHERASRDHLDAWLARVRAERPDVVVVRAGSPEHEALLGPAADLYTVLLTEPGRGAAVFALRPRLGTP